MNLAHKKIALTVCLVASLTGLGYITLNEQIANTSHQPQPEAVQEKSLVAQAEVPKTEAENYPEPQPISLLASSHPLHRITRLTVDTVADVKVFYSENPSIEIVGDSQELIDTIKTQYMDGNLTLSHQLTRSLKLKCGNTSIAMNTAGNSSTMVLNTGRQEKAKPCAMVNIGVKEIPEILIQKSGSVHVSGADQQQLNLYISGSGNITAEGKADELVIWIKGSGDVDATHVLAKRVKILSQGSGNVTAVANGELISALKGSGDITVIGNPVNPTHTETGSGSFRMIGLPSK